MLVEINLLPQKQRRSSSLLRLILILVILLLLCSLLIFWQVNNYNNEINQLTSNITNSEQEISAFQQNMDAASTNSFVELSNAIEWSRKHNIKSVDVLKRLTSLLPKRGFLLNYAYAETGTISLTVQFDTKKEAAYYLKWLTDTEWIKEVKLSQLSSNLTAETEQTTNDDTITKSNQESYLPRYTGTFEITLNNEKIREIQQKNNDSENAKEGGDSK